MTKKVSQKFIESDYSPQWSGDTALTVRQAGGPLVRVEEDVPVPKGAEVLIQVTSAGVCHSDVHIREGYMNMGSFKLPYAAIGMSGSNLAMGHEIVGTLIAAGPDATNVEIGKSYIAWPWGGCMKPDCAACEKGSQNCPNGIKYLGCTIDGGYSTHCLVPHSSWLVPYANISEEFACTLACSGLTAYGAIQKSLIDLPSGTFNDANKLLIFGAGGLGLQAIKICRALFPDYKPSVADIDPKKRAAALEAGAGEVIDPSNAEEMAAQVGKVMTGGGFVRAIDFVGAGASVENAAKLLKLGGATLTIVGLYGGVASLPVTMIVLGQKIQGHGTGSLGEMRELAKLASEGKMDPIPIQNRKLEEAEALLAELQAGKIVGRAVIKPQEA